MDEQHTPETEMNSVFHLIHLIVSLFISLFMLCFEIVIILCIYWHCLDLIY